MSYMLPHLHNGWQVDQAILSEEDRVVVIRFGHDWDPTCMKMDEVLYSIAEKEDGVSGVSLCSNVGGLEVPGTGTRWLKNPHRAGKAPGQALARQLVPQEAGPCLCFQAHVPPLTAHPGRCCCPCLVLSGIFISQRCFSSLARSPPLRASCPLCAA
ncbi:thioredoxin-like protein 4A isoform X1 [Meles meles]|uniref:thioredoxin-like protein 4A isoform X1 n=1 Tax=Meles meles TaxID=9662 RepID=UPI001E69F23E|nr:thioredoxin-like protein 4A isoform X1 [Meles meles]